MANEGEIKLKQQEIEQKEKDKRTERVRLSAYLISEGYCSITLYELENMGLEYMQRLAAELNELKRAKQNSAKKVAKKQVVGVKLDDNFIYPAFEKVNLEKTIKKVIEEAYEHLAKEYPGY